MNMTSFFLQAMELDTVLILELYVNKKYKLHTFLFSK